MKIKKFIPIIFAFPYTVLWIGGIVTYAILPKITQDASWAPPTFLILSACVVIAASNRREAFLYLFAGMVGFVFEEIGVHTGFPFGSYQYLDTVKPSLAGVPLPMISAWIVLPAFVVQLFIDQKIGKLKKIFLNALSLTFIDFLIDPVAIGPMKFWHWQNTGIYYGIPLINFIGWFIISLIIFTILGNVSRKNSWHLHMGFSLVLFFTAIAVSKMMVIPTIIGIVVSLMYLVIFTLFKKSND